nr:hypothetical protein [Tanacetum cinerariifolium]
VTAKVKKVNDQEQIQALVDKKKAIIMEDNIISDLRFDDAEGTSCLLNEAIFEGLARMGIGAGFFGVITPLFDTMIVQAPTDMGDTLVENHQTPIVDQPSTSKPQKKQNPKRKQRKEAEVSNDESEDEDHVIDLQEAKAAQAKEIVTLKKKVTKLNKWRKSRSGGFRRLKKFGSEIALDDKTQGRTNDDEMFGVDDLAGEEVVIDTTTGEHEEQIIEDVSTAEPVTTAGEVVTTTNVKNSAASTTNVTKDGITMAKDKGKAKVIEPEVPIKKKDQMRIDEEYARKLEAKEEEEGKKTYFKIIIADGNSQVYQTFEKMFKNFNREDLEVLWAIVKDIIKKEKPVDDMDNLLSRTLKTMFENHVEDNI